MLPDALRKRLSKFLKRIMLAGDTLCEPNSEWVPCAREISPIDLFKEPDKPSPETDSGSITEFGELVNLLMTIPALEYLRKKDMEEQLRNLICDVFVNRKEYRKSLSRVNDLVAGFEQKIVRPFNSYLVITPVQDIILGPEGWSYRACTLTSLRREELANPVTSELLGYEQFLAKFVDNPVVVAEVQGNSPDKVVERGRAQSVELLDALRTYLSRNLRSRDEHMDFRLSPFSLLVDKSSGMAESSHLAYPKGKPPVMVNVLADSFPAELKTLPDTFSRLAPRMQQAVSRAFGWVSRAVQDEDNDHKIIFLCTALEALLCSKRDRRKGETIVFRMILVHELIGRSFVRPKNLLQIYEKRSSVVHGSGRYEGTDLDYSTLLYAVQNTLNGVLAVASTHNFRSPTEMFTFLDASPQATKALDWLRKSPCVITQAIAEVIAKTLMGSQVTWSTKKLPQLSMRDRLLLYLYHQDIKNGRNGRTATKLDKDREALFQFCQSLAHAKELAFLGILRWDEVDERSGAETPKELRLELPLGHIALGNPSNGSRRRFSSAVKKLIDRGLLRGFIPFLRAMEAPWGGRTAPHLCLKEASDQVRDVVALSLTTEGFLQARKLAKEIGLRMPWEMHPLMVSNDALLKGLWLPDVGR